MNDLEIFAAARQITNLEERSAYVAQACGGNEPLRERVEALLRSAEAAKSLLESPASAVAAALDPLGEMQATVPGTPEGAGEVEARTLGDYRIIDEIGRGGMGVVYEAEQISLGRRVALKVLSYASILDKTHLARFRNEARAAASLDHPNVVSVHAVGSHRGVHFYAMQLIDGQTVADLISEERSRRGLEKKVGRVSSTYGASPEVPGDERRDSPEFDVSRRKAANSVEAVSGNFAGTTGGREEIERIRRVAELGIQAAEALEHAHRMGIVHRDIKPSNLLVDADRHLWVTDFGLAMIEAEGNLTVTRGMVGTLRYMSPEQMRGDRHVLDHHTDIYSLGATLYELLTLHAAFPDSDATRLMQRVLGDEPVAPRKLNADIPRDLETIVLTAMAKDREDRYATAKELAVDLRRFLNHEPIQAEPPGLIERIGKCATRHRPIVRTAAMTIAVAVIVAGGLLWRQRSQTLAAYAAEKEQHAIALRNAAEARRQAKAAEAARTAEAAARREADHEKERALAAQAEAEKAWERAERETEHARQRERFARQLVYAGDVQLAAQAWDRGDVRQYADLLDGGRGGEEDVRGFEWRYLRQLGQADYRCIAEETGGTSCVRHAPSGKYLVMGQYDGTIRLLDTQSNEVLTSWQGHEGLVRGMDFSPAGDRLVSIGDDGIVHEWSFPSHQEVCAFQADRGIGFAVFFALDGKMLVSCGEQPNIRLWDADTGEHVGELSTEGARFRAITVSPDGRYCVGGGAGLTFTWDLETRERIEERRGDVVRCLQFSPEGAIYAAGTTQQLIYLCRVDTGAVIAVLEGHEDDIEDLAFRPSGGLLASADRAGVIRTWVLNEDNSPVRRSTKDQLSSFHAMDPSPGWPRCFHAHAARTWSLEFAPDGERLVSGSKDGTVRSWSGRPPVLKRLPSTSSVVDVAFAGAGDELFVCERDRLRIWNHGSNQNVTLGLDVDEEKHSLALSPAGMTVVCGDTQGRLHFWDRQQGRVAKTISGHEDDVDRIEFSPDGTLVVTASWDGTARLWNSGSFQELARFDLPPHCCDAGFSPCGQLLAISWEDYAGLYDVTTRQRLRMLRGHQNTVACLAFSPDGRLLATGSHDRTVRLWDVHSGQIRYVIPAHQDKITAIAYSPDGRTVVSGDRSGTLAFSHAATGRLLYTLKVAAGTIHDLEFSSDGRSLAVAADDQAVLLEVRLWVESTPIPTEANSPASPRPER